MKRFYYDNLRDIYSSICTEQTKPKRKLIKEYGYRSTASGNRVERGEPNEKEQLRQSDAIRKNELARMKKASLERLKAKNAVPTRKDGTKTFEQFRFDAGATFTEELSKEKVSYLKQVFNSANALDFDKWMLFITEML